ncbi:MAG: hypothetical protein KGI00_03540 [Candidatus Micrarchaeota archaeon]|nr:hypothetical protein [Candidatus Micrarchaeota archaeon]MDE1824481.1 hypothetical protein [Candidatus Micrarchaeota archaeon]MDE1849776.1 hypothetical protein [Candidatus Micrarchaeota archaeon]
MKHHDRIISMLKSLAEYEEKLRHHNPDSLPNGVDMKKLESAYDELSDYEFRLVKKSASRHA